MSQSALESAASAKPTAVARLRRAFGTSRHAGTAWLMVSPAVLFFSVFVLYPIGNAFYVSLTSWDLVSAPRFIGLRNYERLLTDRNFLHSAAMTIYYSSVLLIFE